MFSIETIEDVKILKELTNPVDFNRIKSLELKVEKLSEENTKLFNLAKKQNDLIEEFSKSLVSADDCRDIVFDLLNNSSKKENISKKQKPHVEVNFDEEPFKFTNVMQKKFNKILIDGNTLIHYTVKNQRMKIPVTTVQLLALVEIYQKRHRKFLNKDSQNFCRVYKINKVQFGKVYYNLKEGVFFKALNEIDNQIRKTNFKYKNGTIHIMDGGNLVDTKIDSELFNYFLNIYINSNQPYATIYKLTREKPNINPIHILAVLRKNEAASKAIIDG